MAVQSATTSVLGQQGAQAQGYDAFKNLDMDQFIKLLVTELANQDPLNPMDNSEILQQVSQIKAIASNDRLSETLDSVLLGQNLTTASSLLGQQVYGLSDDAKKVAGQVDRISVVDGVPKLYVGEQTLSLKNVAGILPLGSEYPQEYITVADVSENGAGGS